MPETNGNARNGVFGRVHEGVHAVNPFKTHSDPTVERVVTLKILTAISYIVVLVHAIYYTFARPHEGQGPRNTIWGQNERMRTPFAMNSVITSIYWIVLFVLQIGYSYHLYSADRDAVKAATNVGGHFIVHNLFLFGFIQLWVRSFFWLGELLLIINFFNLSAAYFRHNTTPRAIHIAVVSGPLAWNFVALYWVGAAAVHAHTLPARIVANIFIWGILVYGGFFLVVYKDYTMGFALSVLAASIGVHQFLQHIIAFQWIFAFTIMGVLFVLSLAVGVPGLVGQDPFKRGEIVSEDRERAPLLADQ
ncbi:hypothetical protein MPH_07174 [Macrophomina phaseolina MS6]|uniref:ATP synthase F0 n=1 Tax=Macrophomina phaseolina (strain MS6) TaxID=1126212 RepID=K2RZT4_MACPH|nr:hypothetical protein MPH_07174 [Macrophomina phaseolina MS6]